MSEKEKIETCYRQMYRGMVEKDRELLLEVLDDSFVLIHMTGMRQSKTAFVRAVYDGTLNYFFVDHRHMKVEIHGNQATLLGQSVVDAAVFGGGRHTWRLQLTLQLIQKEEMWKIVVAEASTY